MIIAKEEQNRVEMGKRVCFERQLQGMEELVNDLLDKLKAEESHAALHVAHCPPMLLFYGADIEADG